jgi:hypothetical protein
VLQGMAEKLPAKNDATYGFRFFPGRSVIKGFQKIANIQNDMRVWTSSILRSG